MVIVIGAVIALSMVATLIVVQILQSRITGHVQPAYQAAATNATSIIMQPLQHQTLAILAFSVLAVAIAWLTGPYRWATGLVTSSRQYLTRPLHGELFRSENGFTGWLGANRQTVQWSGVALIALIMLLVRLSVGLVIAYGALMLGFILLVEILAAPHSRGKR